MEQNKETIFILSKAMIISDEQDEYYDGMSDFNRLRARSKYGDELNSLEVMDQFNRILEDNKLDTIDIDKLDNETASFLNFIIRDRIGKKLNYKLIVNFETKYWLCFFPECPEHLIYKMFVLTKTSIDKLENEMIEILNIMKHSELFSNINISKSVHFYLKIRDEIVKSFIEKFSFSKEEKIYRILLESRNKINELADSISFLIGDEIYLSSRGKKSDLNYIMFVKEYYKKLM